MLKRIDPDDVLDRLKMVVIPYPKKAMAADLGKVYSTFDNELEARGTSKLGLVTALRVIKLSQAPSAPAESRRAGASFLDFLAEIFGRVMFQVPSGTAPQYAQLTTKFGRLAQEVGEALQKFGKHLADGSISVEEAEELLRELDDVIRVAAAAKDVVRRTVDAEVRP